MNKQRKTLLKFVAGIALVGAGLMLIALCMGADFRDIQVEFHRVLKPESVKLVDTEMQISPDEFRGIELEIRDGMVSVEAWQEHYVEVSHNGGFRRCDVRLENGIYEIEEDMKEGIGLFRVNKEKELTIRVPEDMIMDLLDVSLGAGSVEVHGAAVSELSAEVGAGSFIYEGTLNGNAELECGAGEMILHLNGNPENYNYNMECGIGALMVNGTEYNGIGGDHSIQNDADKTIQLTCGVGQIELTIEE